MSHRILVIDHHPEGLRRVVDPLKEAGYDVVEAQTAAEGATAFQGCEPDLVFIAARLPRTHGTALCRELKRTNTGSYTPIVLIVESTAVLIDLPQLDQFGADRLIQKPVSRDEMLELSAELIGRKVAAADAGAFAQDPTAEPEDGLNTALAELDSLEFDLPEATVPETAATPSAVVPLSANGGDDIEERLDDLFNEKPSAAGASSAPSQGQDKVADGKTFEETGGNTGQPPLEERSAPSMQASASPGPAPPAQGATAAVREPDSGSTRGRFQTEVLTRERTMPQQILPATDSKPAAGLPRWSWVAVPTLIGVVALVVVFMTRTSVEPAKDSVLSVIPPVSSGNDGASMPGTASAGVELFGPPPDSLPETTAVDDETGGAADLVATESPLPVESLPVEPDEEPRARASVEVRDKPAVLQEPEPLPVKPEPVAPRATVAVQEPVRQPEPAPSPVEVPIARTPAVVELEPFDEPERVLEPEPFEEPEQTSEPEPVVPEPVTRAPVVVRRVEPRVSEKDLKDGGGTVVLSVRVSSTGLVTRILVEQGLPGSPLEAAAVAAVLRWRYEPALDRGQPVEASTTARFTFGD